MKRWVSLFFVGLLTVGLISAFEAKEGYAQRSVNVSAPVQSAAAIANASEGRRTAEGWTALYPREIAPTVGSITPSGNTVIVYRWSAIAWKKLALRWIAVLGFTWLLGSTANNSRWGSGYWLGAVLGSVGFFLLSPLYINHVPHWPIAVLGSSLPDLGSIFTPTAALNPITASALIPFLMLSFLLSHPRFSWMTVGVSVGFAAVLSLSFFIQPAVLWLGAGLWARLFLAVNALICLLIAYLSLKTITEPS